MARNPVVNLFRKYLVVDDSILDGHFVLVDDEKDQDFQQESKGGTSHDDESTGHPLTRSPIDALGDTVADTLNPRNSKKPVSMQTFIENGSQKYEEAVAKSHRGLDDPLPIKIEELKDQVEKFFYLPRNKDIVLREFTVGTERLWRGFLVFVDGMADKTIINNHILEPLMYLTKLQTDDSAPARRHLEEAAERLVPGNQVEIMDTWAKIVPGILTGSTAVFLDGCDGAILVETKGWEHRNVGLATTENVVRGPHDAFTESFRANTGLVRARLRSEHLITEMMSVGSLAKTDVAIMYVEGLTNPKIIAEVKDRIAAIDVDYIGDSGILEQFLEDETNVMIPQVLSTERPDRIASMLTEGHVAIFVGNSPFALAVPVVLWTLVHSPEDSYMRFPFGTFIRGLRWVSLLTAVLLPSLYIAVTNYHPEMIPTQLMLSIAGSREQVPFPVVAEILLMEFAIELIREAGIRIPSAIGPTIGIVGALIIGQAAVQAGIVSPLMVIVVAVTALAAFTLPSYNLNLAVRVTRFFFLAVASILGFYGIAILLCVYLVRLSTQTSFGVPLLAPVAPSMDTSPDVFRRGPVFKMNQLPTYLQTLRSWRQQPITRPWSVNTRPKGFKKRGRRGTKQP